MSSLHSFLRNKIHKIILNACILDPKFYQITELPNSPAACFIDLHLDVMDGDVICIEDIYGIQEFHRYKEPKWCLTHYISPLKYNKVINQTVMDFCPNYKDTFIIDPLEIQPEPTYPENNDGKRICCWCGAPTKKISGFSSSYDVCSVCGK